MRFTRSKISLAIILMILDILGITASLFFSYHFRFFSNIFPIDKGLPDWQFYQYALYYIIPLWIFIFSKHNFYKVFFLPSFDELIRIIRAVSTGTIFLLLTTFFYRDFSYSRLILLLFWISSIFSIFILREFFKLFGKYFLRSIIGCENILIVGKENRMLRAVIKKHPHMQVFYFPYEDESEIEKLKKIIVEKNINQIMLVHQNWPENALMKFYDWCENIHIDLKFVPNIVQLCKGEIDIDSSLGIPLLHLRSISFSGFNFYFKRIIDLFISITILSMIWPLFLLIIIIIKNDSPGPFFYNHKRMGYRGRVFSFYKFRTMVNNADALLEKFKNKSEREGPVFKMSNDPRVTKIGKILRRYSIDELPQLINVIKGDMSLVGPRPQVLWEASAYDDWAKRRLRILPGITGLWQISGRASLSYKEMIELDIYYIENWSCGMDIKILLKTLPAIFSKKGAC